MKYKVEVVGYVSTIIEVEAANEDDAIDKAYEETSGIGLCNYCSRNLELGELDQATIIKGSDHE